MSSEKRSAATATPAVGHKTPTGSLHDPNEKGDASKYPVETAQQLNDIESSENGDSLEMTDAEKARILRKVRRDELEKVENRRASARL